MKTSIKIIAIGVLLSCVACGAKKSTQSKMEEDEQEMSAKATDETQGETAEVIVGMDQPDNSAPMSENTMGEDANGNADSSTESTSVPSSSSSNMNYLSMYSELEMTDGQIQKFEGALRDFYTQQKNTPNGEMMGTLSDERERQLKEILSEDQYSAYESWKMDN